MEINEFPFGYGFIRMPLIKLFKSHSRIKIGFNFQLEDNTTPFYHREHFSHEFSYSFPRFPVVLLKNTTKESVRVHHWRREKYVPIERDPIEWKLERACISCSFSIHSRSSSWARSVCTQLMKKTLLPTFFSGKLFDVKIHRWVSLSLSSTLASSREARTTDERTEQGNNELFPIIYGVKGENSSTHSHRLSCSLSPQTQLNPPPLSMNLSWETCCFLERKRLRSF